VAIASVVAALLMVVPGIGAAAARGADPSGSSGQVRPGFPGAVRHVIVIAFENQIASSVFEYGPFLRYLAERYGYATHYYGVCHPSAPNYLAMTGGAARQCGTDRYHVYDATNLGDLLDAAHRSWAGFAESMPYPCDTTNHYPYFVKHNPFVYYADIVDNATRCRAHDLPLSAWYGDVANGTLPNYAFIAPNMTNDDHDTSIAYADAWLRGFLGPQLNGSWMQSSVVFITYDEGIGPRGFDLSGYNGTDGGHLYFAAVGPWVRANSIYSPDATHFDLLSTTEWLLGLGGTGANDGPAFPAITSWFTFVPGSGPGEGSPPWAGWGLGLPGWLGFGLAEQILHALGAGAGAYAVPRR
jgi:hypothetical protein